MKKSLIFALAVCAAFAFSSCKSSRDAAYRQAWEKAKTEEKNNNAQATTENTAAVTPVTPVVTPVQPTKVTPVAPKTDNSDVRTIQGDVKVVNGEALKTYSVVVGSFVTQANAEKLQSTLRESGFDARVIHTNETINGQTGWFRVIASSFDDKAAAAQSRDELIGKYTGAWLLYNK